MPELPKTDEEMTPSVVESETDQPPTADVVRGSYYYDDACGYEDFDPESADED